MMYQDYSYVASDTNLPWLGVSILLLIPTVVKVGIALLKYYTSANAHIFVRYRHYVKTIIK